MFVLDDTIAALASAAGAGGRGIIRCSGPDVVAVLEQRFSPHDAAAWQNAPAACRHSGVWRLTEIDRSLPLDVYLWPSSRSYTGQKQAEIHAIGSPPLLEAILSGLFQAGARPARAGEFTLRAFLAGRVDLMQAEAVLGVIDAADHVELQTALTQLSGGISHRLTQLRFEFVDLLADLEAGLDFTEEGLEFVSRQVLFDRIVAARVELEGLLDRARHRTRHTVVPRVVIAGPPNAGKSTLFNALLGKAAALVSPIAGTTRDYLTAHVAWNGVSLELVDTAGWEETTDGILQAALELRAGQLERADLILECRAADETSAVSAATVAENMPTSAIKVLTKCDCRPAFQPDTVDEDRVLVSAWDGTGLDRLKQLVIRHLRSDQPGEADILGSTAARCHDSLTRAIEALSRAAELAELGGGDEFLATDVRTALDEIGAITGAIYTDDLLDRIFAKFCIGK